MKYFILIPLLINFTPKSVYAVEVNDATKENIQNEINLIFNDRCSMFLTGDLSSLPYYFDTSNKFGTWALEHEIKRIRYLRDWSNQRDIKFTNIESETQIKKVTPTSRGMRVRADEYYKFQYIYPNDAEPIINNFGVSLIHSMELIKKGDRWIIYNDWYTDCFEDALKSYSGELNDKETPSDKPKYTLPCCPKEEFIQKDVPKGHYNRVKAVEYADKYCGIPWASGNPQKYNKKYKNFTGIGGNCTNYVSQCLGDTEGGGLKFDGTWYCIYNKYDGASGSSAWVNADALKNYLIYSGRGMIIKKGDFKAVTSPTNELSCGAVSKLQLGDLICYAKGSDIDHFAIVTGFDSHGYPLINSHTTDRYHVPWDLGWGDKNISFYLIHMR